MNPCPSGREGSAAFQDWSTVVTISSIHLRSAAVSVTSAVSFGFRISSVAESIWRTSQACQWKAGAGHAMGPATHVDENVDMALSLLLEDAVGRPDEICPRLKQVDLLQRQVRLKERVLEKSIEVSRPGAEVTRSGARTLPKTSSGSPRYRIKLYLSLVRKLDGFSRR